MEHDGVGSKEILSVKECRFLWQFARGYISIHAKYDFQRLSHSLQCLLVEFMAAMVEADPAQKWTSWPQAVHEKCCTGKLKKEHPSKPVFKTAFLFQMKNFQSL